MSATTPDWPPVTSTRPKTYPLLTTSHSLRSDYSYKYTYPRHRPTARTDHGRDIQKFTSIGDHSSPKISRHNKYTNQNFVQTRRRKSMFICSLEKLDGILRRVCRALGAGYSDGRMLGARCLVVGRQGWRGHERAYGATNGFQPSCERSSSFIPSYVSPRPPRRMPDSDRCSQ